MKTRIGLVSNSSSACFLVSYDPLKTRCNHCGWQVNIIDLIESLSRFGASNDYDTETETDRVIKEVDNLFSDKDYVKELTNKIVDLSSDNPVIYIKTSIHNELVKRELKLIKRFGGIVMNLDGEMPI